jgi:hypothetical protein
LAAAVVISLSSGAVFAGAVMARVAYMALSISRFVCVEVVERLLPARRHRPSITMMRVVAIVYMAIKAVRTVKPRAGTDEHPTTVPIRPIIPVGGTVIRSVVVISVGTYRFNTNVDTDLSLCFGSDCHQADAS